MRAFANLYAELDASTSTLRKVDALARYLASAPSADAAWAVYLLAGRKPRQAVPTRVLREAVCQVAQIPQWLFEESYQAVGDLAETIAHLLPEAGAGSQASLSHWMDERLGAWRGLSAEDAARAVQQAWQELDGPGRFVLNKLVTGGFRVGISRQGVARAIAQAFGLDPLQVAERMVGYTDARTPADSARFEALIAPPGTSPGSGSSRPYPFFLAHALQASVETLGPIADWRIEWKWDGIRAQLVWRAGKPWLWSRGEELVTDRFPELIEAAPDLPPLDLVLDGELLAWDLEGDRPLPFHRLQRRITRKTVTASIRREAPVIFLAYDLLEYEGVDLRGLTQEQRGERLRALFDWLGQRVCCDASAAGGSRDRSFRGAGRTLRLAPALPANAWAEAAQWRDQARSLGVEGLMLKHNRSVYGAGRVRPDAVSGWWKWKVDPYSVDAVMLYAQRGHGRRASLYTDYTFGVWNADRSSLLPFAKAYSGLSDAEIREVDRLIRKSTRESFGPVRSLEPGLVFEIGFEGIAASPRHKAGLAVRFPRIVRWRTDKTIDEADTIEVLRALIRTADSGPGPTAFDGERFRTVDDAQ